MMTIRVVGQAGGGSLSNACIPPKTGPRTVARTTTKRTTHERRRRGGRPACRVSRFEVPRGRPRCLRGPRRGASRRGTRRHHHRTGLHPVGGQCGRARPPATSAPPPLCVESSTSARRSAARELALNRPDACGAVHPAPETANREELNARRNGLGKATTFPYGRPWGSEHPRSSPSIARHAER